VLLHPICHKTIHSNFTNSELARIGDDPDTIRANPSIAKFAKWVERKESDFHAPRALLTLVVREPIGSVAANSERAITGKQ